MAGACSCKSCCLGGLREGWKRLGGLRPGKRQSLSSSCSCKSCCVGGLRQDWKRLGACAFACDPRAKFHTSGGPRRRPCLGKGRGRRIYGYSWCFSILFYRSISIVEISPFQMRHRISARQPRSGGGSRQQLSNCACASRV